MGIELSLPDVSDFQEGEAEMSIRREAGSPYMTIRYRLAHNLLLCGGANANADAHAWALKDAFGPFMQYYDLEYKEWVRDGTTIALQRELIDEFGEEAYEPTQVELLNNLRGIINNKLTPEKDRVAAVKLMADIMGYIKRPSEVTVNNNNNMIHNVMRIPVRDDLDAFEAAGLEQQTKLVEDARDKTLDTTH